MSIRSSFAITESKIATLRAGQVCLRDFFFELEESPCGRSS
jgi:hypothetical protein